jgi:phosphate transport system substrate-binding protein
VEIEQVIIAYDALTVIVNPANSVSKLTREQLEQIFGTIKTGRKCRC